MYFKNLFFHSSIIELKRDIDKSVFTEANIQDLKNPSVYITYGQSNSANYGQIGYKVTKNTYMYFENKIYKYEDPSLGATGNNGSVWGRVGDYLISNNFSNSVIFFNAGYGGSTIDKLLYGKRYDYFINNIVEAKKKFNKINAILIMQGEANHEEYYGSKKYIDQYNTLINLIKIHTDAPIIISLSSFCNNYIDKNLINKQKDVIKMHANVYEGPYTDSLIEKTYRLPDLCHMSEKGFDTLAKMWGDSIINNTSFNTHQ